METKSQFPKIKLPMSPILSVPNTPSTALPLYGGGGKPKLRKVNFACGVARSNALQAGDCEIERDRQLAVAQALEASRHTHVWVN